MELDIVEVRFDESKYKKEEITKIEKDVKEISSLFEEVNLLVANQQESLNHIEDFVYTANNNITKGNVELKKANKYSKMKKGLILGSLCAANIPLSILFGPQISIPLTLSVYGSYKLIKK